MKAYRVTTRPDEIDKKFVPSEKGHISDRGFFFETEKEAEANAKGRNREAERLGIEARYSVVEVGT